MPFPYVSSTPYSPNLVHVFTGSKKVAHGKLQMTFSSQVAQVPIFRILELLGQTLHPTTAATCNDLLSKRLPETYMQSPGKGRGLATPIHIPLGCIALGAIPGHSLATCCLPPVGSVLARARVLRGSSGLLKRVLLIEVAGT